MLEQAPRDAVVFVALIGFGTLLLLIVVDVWLTLTRRQPVGAWVSQWARRYPVFALGLALVAGGLLGHFLYATNP